MVSGLGPVLEHLDSQFISHRHLLVYILQSAAAPFSQCAFADVL